MCRKILKHLLYFLLFIAFGVSCYLVFQPCIKRTESQKEAQTTADAFLEQYRATKEGAEAAIAIESSELSGSAAPTESKENTAVTERAERSEETLSEERLQAELFEAMQVYNRKIFAEGQSGLCDPWSYTVPALDLSAYGLTAGEAIGVLEIPAIDVVLPIYSGASSAHLAKGAALLSQTSFPIGGKNTNAVIGAHRGWNAEDYLRNIEDVQLGDKVSVTNFWEELHYTVVEIKVIEPDDISQVLIQPNRELLTVFSCHPYASGSKYRYLLICERREAATAAPEVSTEINTMESAAEAASTKTKVDEALFKRAEPSNSSLQGCGYTSSKTEILLVSVLPYLGITILMVLSIIGWRVLRKHRAIK